jgi:hypothetical protein
MFVADAPTAAAIRKAYVESGELSAVVELRRQFPGIAYTHRSGRTLMLRTVAGGSHGQDQLLTNGQPPPAIGLKACSAGIVRSNSK